MRSVFLVGLLTLAVAAPAQNQRKLGPRSFFPKEYTGEAYVNLDALQDTDLWDEVERSLIVKPMFAVFRREFGFAFTDLMEIRAALVSRKISYGNGYETVRSDSVVVFQSSAKLELPGNRPQEHQWNRRTKKEIGGHEVVQEGEDNDDNPWSGAWLYVVPQPHCIVYGDKKLIEPVLEGKRRGGVPHPELMAFTAGRKPLAYFARKLKYDEGYLRDAAPFPFSWYTTDDKPTFMMVRLNVDEQTQNTSVSLHMRFTDGSKGPQLFEQELRKSFKKLDTDKHLKRMTFLKAYVKLLKFKTDGADLKITCDLGSPKVAARLTSIAQLLPWLFMIRPVASAGVVMDGIEEADVPVPVKLKKKEAPKKEEPKKKEPAKKVGKK